MGSWFSVVPPHTALYATVAYVAVAKLNWALPASSEEWGNFEALSSYAKESNPLRKKKKKKKKKVGYEVCWSMEFCDYRYIKKKKQNKKQETMFY